MFYERYLQLCQKAELSPSAAATKAGFNKGTVSVWKKKFEAGRDVIPEQDVIDKICAFFGCSEQWLRDLKEKAPAPEGERIENDVNFSRYLQLNPANRSIVDSLIAQLLENQSSD